MNRNQAGVASFRDGKRLFASRINEGMKEGVLRVAIKSLGPREESRNCSLMSQSRVRGNVGRKDYTTFSSLLFRRFLLHWYRGNLLSYSYCRVNHAPREVLGGVRTCKRKIYSKFMRPFPTRSCECTLTRKLRGKKEIRLLQLGKHRHTTGGWVM